MAQDSFCGAGGVQLLPLCSIPPKMSRDGYAGQYASIYLPFYGQYFFSGQQMAFPQGFAPQNTARFIGGRSIPGNFTKGYTCDCNANCG